MRLTTHYHHTRYEENGSEGKFALRMPRRKSSVFKAPVLIQFQVTADIQGGYRRGRLLDRVVWHLCDDLMAWGAQRPLLAKFHLLGLWLGPRLGPTDHHSLSLGQWRGPGEAFLALLCFFRRSPVPASLSTLGTGHALWRLTRAHGCHH